MDVQGTPSQEFWGLDGALEKADIFSYGKSWAGPHLQNFAKVDEQGEFSQDCFQDRPGLFEAEHDLFTAGEAVFIPDVAGTAAQPTALLDGERSLASSRIHG